MRDVVFFNSRMQMLLVRLFPLRQIEIDCSRCVNDGNLFLLFMETRRCIALIDLNDL